MKRPNNIWTLLAFVFAVLFMIHVMLTPTRLACSTNLTTQIELRKISGTQTRMTAIAKLAEYGVLLGTHHKRVAKFEPPGPIIRIMLT